MGTNLDDLSAELFAWVAQYLDVQDLGNLRLLNRTFAPKAILGSYSQAIRVRRVQLTCKSLQTFANAISTDAVLGRFIEDVTLVGITCDSSTLEYQLEAGRMRNPKYDQFASVDDDGEAVELEDEFIVFDDEELDQMEAATDELAEQQGQIQRDQELIAQLLCRVFTLIAAQARVLKRLSLQVAVLEDPRKPPSLPRDAPRSALYPGLEVAARIFALTMSSLQGLPVLSLDIFDANPESLQCSVPCDLLARTNFKPQELLTSLSISILDTLSATTTFEDLKNARPNVDGLIATATRDENFTGLSHFLKSCPVLEELRISHYVIPNRVDSVREVAQKSIPRQIFELAKTVHHPRLRSLSLGGLKADCRDLLIYLGKHRTTLESLELRESSISKGTGLINEIMELLQDFPRLQTIAFDSVHSDGSLCLYSGERERPNTRISGWYLGQSAIHRTGDDVRKLLEYWHRRGPRVPVIDNPMTRDHQNTYRLEFGRR
jgi:hypothetical protein